MTTHDLYVHGFCDLNLCPNPATVENIKTMCKALIELGYRAVAINTQVEESVFESKKKGGKKKAGPDRSEPGDIIPPPLDLSDLVEEYKGKFGIYQRLTVPISDNLQVHKLSQSKNASKYNLLAVIPQNMTAYQIACSQMDVDIITFDFTSRSSLRLPRKLVSQTIQRRVYFELLYSACVLDSSVRRNTIALAHALHAVGRAKSRIIVASGASHIDQLRSPYDIANFSILFGLSEEQTRNCLKNNCKDVLWWGHNRRTKAFATVRLDTRYDESRNEPLKKRMRYPSD